MYDLIPPTFSYFPPDVTVYCTEDEASEEPIAADNCEVVSTGMTDSQELVPGGPAGSYLVRRSWWAVDKAGNDVTAEQRVVVLPTGPDGHPLQRQHRDRTGARRRYGLIGMRPRWMTSAMAAMPDPDGRTRFR